MQTMPLLIIGAASDGPTAEPVRCDNLDDAAELFGAYWYQYFTVNPATTSLTLSGQPWTTQVEIFYDDDGTLRPYYLHNLQVTGTSLTFARAGVDKQLIAKYPRTLEAGSAYRACLEASLAGSPGIYLMRVGGTAASGCIGSGDTRVELQSMYSGELYNTVTITLSDGNLLIRPPAGRGILRSHAASSTVAELAEAINLDRQKGYGVCRATALGTGTPSGVASLTLSGGTDGSPGASDITSLLEAADLSHALVATVAGSTIADLSDVLTQSYLSSLATPTMFVQAARPLSGSETAADYALSLASNTVLQDRRLSVVASSGYVRPRSGVAYWANAAPAYASLLAGQEFSTTWKAIGAEDLLPAFSSESLSSLAGNGYVALARSIASGICVYRGTTSYPGWTSNYFMAWRHSVEEIRAELEDLIGEVRPPKAQIEDMVDSALGRVPGLSDYAFEVGVYSDKVDISVKLYPVGELRSIVFKVSVIHGTAINS